LKMQGFKNPSFVTDASSRKLCKSFIILAPSQISSLLSSSNSLSSFQKGKLRALSPSLPMTAMSII
jgi:hypothetical protein